ncbi:hypothetical protein DH2020_016290 [Rehmannia glutinosa]|uniref:Protein kinase domain-containing protein n=1 Tax=Rehmannia glutinosa TaxID=99300 RepID=A0ABR0WRG2_REHGL
MAIVHVHGPFIFFSISTIIFHITTSSTESEALLKLKQSFTNPKALDSWKPGTEPCSGNNNTWAGITCQNGVVSGLHLGHSGLSGKIDVDALVSLSGLRSLALMSNGFSARFGFPSNQALRGLYISGNQFSGQIPSDYFSEMEGLKKVWLSGNRFTGPIPDSLARLAQLMELHLENNRFSGTIPPLEQQSLISLDLSNNNLEGEIPSGLSRFGDRAFAGNPGLCGGNSGRTCDPKKHSSHKGMGIGFWFIVAFIVVLLLAIAGIYLVRRRHTAASGAPAKENLDNRLDSSSGSVGKKDTGSSRKGFGGSRVGSSRKRDLELMNDEKGVFGLGDLMRAAAEVLGTGQLGSSYKATMDSGFTVVVKRMTELGKMGREKFDGEMRRFGSLKHKNVLTPLAYHYRKDEKLLVYEYQHTGSLMFVLHGDRGFSHDKLDWPARLNIIQGIANGLSYLHTELSSCDIPHGNLKSSNVLLTPDYDPLLVDYGLCSLMNQAQAAHTLIAFKSPEATNNYQTSPKCDVYCLGIIILEILTGKFPRQYLNNSQGGMDLIQWVRSAIAEGREADLLDPDIIVNSASFVGEMVKLLRIGADCTENDPDGRLDLREAIRRIEGLFDDRLSVDSQSRALEHCSSHSSGRNFALEIS